MVNADANVNVNVNVNGSGSGSGSGSGGGCCGCCGCYGCCGCCGCFATSLRIASTRASTRDKDSPTASLHGSIAVNATLVLTPTCARRGSIWDSLMATLSERDEPCLSAGTVLANCLLQTSAASEANPRCSSGGNGTEGGGSLGVRGPALRVKRHWLGHHLFGGRDTGSSHGAWPAEGPFLYKGVDPSAVALSRRKSVRRLGWAAGVVVPEFGTEATARAGFGITTTGVAAPSAGGGRMHDGGKTGNVSESDNAKRSSESFTRGALKDR